MATTPRSSPRRTSRPEPWASRSGAGGAETAMKPLPPIRAIACERAEDSGSSGRGKGMRSMMTSWQAEPGTSTPLPEREGAEQAGPGVAGKLSHQGRGLVLPLAKELDAVHARALVRALGESFAHLLGRGDGCTHRGEQAEGPAAGGTHQLLDLVERLGRHTVTSRCRQMLCNVRDGLARVVERAADVEALPRRGTLTAQSEGAGNRIERAAELEGGRRHDDRAIAKHLVPHQHCDAHGRHSKHGATAWVLAHPRDIELAPC